MQGESEFSKGTHFHPVADFARSSTDFAFQETGIKDRKFDSRCLILRIKK